MHSGNTSNCSYFWEGISTNEALKSCQQDEGRKSWEKNKKRHLDFGEMVNSNGPPGGENG